MNFRGSSPVMEAEAAQILWNRFVQCLNVRYRWMVSDGNSKAFNIVEAT